MKQFKNLIEHVLTNGRVKTDRTGVGTTSVFGYQTRFNMADGFPLVTLKKTHMKSIVHELLWFLRGETNIQSLVQNGVNIWNEWPYERYKKHAESLSEPDYSVHIEDVQESKVRILTLAEFVERIKVDNDFAKQWGECGPIYGYQWRNWRGKDSTTGNEHIRIDQLQNAINTLKKSPDSRRIIVTAWQPAEIDEMALPPCHAFFQFITEPLTDEERIHWAMTNLDLPMENVAITEAAFGPKTPKYRISLQMYQRSCDLLLGVPFNIASYALLLHMVAQCVNMVPHEFIHTFGDLHIYNNHLEAAKTLLEREPLKLPTLKLNPQITDIFAFKYEDITIENYVSHPAIKLDVAV